MAQFPPSGPSVPPIDGSSVPSGPSSSSTLPEPPKATSILLIGMAGSGKSTFAGALSRSATTSEAVASKSKSKDEETQTYMVNLDPAVLKTGYEPNVDIRDTVDYKRVMEEYNLGPNGGILTSLNLFTTKYDQVLSILERRAQEVEYIVHDTPGQIEIFTWSASGSIITSALASSMPTCVAYVIDTPRTTAPATFMSNMLYACSIMYKTRLPFILVFNKTDVQPSAFATEWMSDFEAFQAALNEGNATEPSSVATNRPGSGRRRTGEDAGYINSLMNSMALVLDEFYSNLRTVSVSSVTGEGLPNFFKAVDEARAEYLADYRPELERLAKAKAEARDKKKKQELERLMKDMKMGGAAPSRGGVGSTAGDQEEDEGSYGDRYEGDGQIIDPVSSKTLNSEGTD
ncbi:hypothetical protein IE81DRAFT_286794 [Ceraceosorus guamensis]|uniref:GPN-loop GTPase n=1 Tax=Ceraceosorus guamensis TaxID=1522189 RepID=A0A316W4C3_9BASI|nr:hypothetical protein IE81DRAFT_286794 [Ceraceosorus guamensis]PWN44776.1 hypothetical protein IE81DRAFT_286794 [Ceraceosorus guamensis]